jgi:hypothetical protein
MLTDPRRPTVAVPPPDTHHATPDQAMQREGPAGSSRLKAALRDLDVKDAPRVLRERRNGGGE